MLRCAGSYVKFVLKLFCLRASLSREEAASNVSSSHDSLLIRLLMDEGNCRLQHYDEAN